MKTTFLRSLGALALASTAFAAQAAGVELTLTGWAFGDGRSVQATGYGGLAGGFSGKLAGAGVFDSTAFQTYCIELEEHFGFSPAPLAGPYTVVAGAGYFQARLGDAGVADRLGQLMTWVADDPLRVDDANESTSLQLAIWNLVYDKDWSLANKSGAKFSDTSGYAAYANVLLNGAQTVTTSDFDVYALKARGSQDFLLLAAKPGSTNSNTVPEPASLGLVAAALAGLALTRRRG